MTTLFIELTRGLGPAIDTRQSVSKPG